MPRYVFVTGGVVSSIGKGIVSASLGLLLESRGYKVAMMKLDPYINVDPGTMNPLHMMAPKPISTWGITNGLRTPTFRRRATVPPAAFITQ